MGTANRKTSEGEHKFTQLRGLVREGPPRKDLRKAVEGDLQVYSVKKTCGSEFENCRKAARSVPLQLGPYLLGIHYGPRVHRIPISLENSS